MDFAKKQLEKYGWREGKGLGKDENGISAPVKPKLKFDNAGIGHDVAEQFTNNWWENVYNQASNNVNVTTTANGKVHVNVKNPDAVEITTKNYSLKNLKKKTNGLEYGTFLKTSKLTETGIVDFDNNYYDPETYSVPKTETRPLTDEELFAACGGRTAHKGARHGIALSGKLSRLEKQERLLLKKLKKVSLSDETEGKNKKSLEKKLKKIDAHKNKHKCEAREEDMDILPTGSQNALGVSSPHKSSTKRKKERKRVSFSETVTEYQTPEVDSSVTDNQSQDLDSGSLSDGNSQPCTSKSTVVRQVKIKDTKEKCNENAVLMVLLTDLDEGIDCSDFDYVKEKDPSGLQAKIKEENKQMKRKLKKLRKKCGYTQTETGEFPKEHFIIEKSDEDSLDATEHCIKPVKLKRKIILDQEDCENAEKKMCCCASKSGSCQGAVRKVEKLSRLTKKELKRQLKREKRLEKRIDQVADSLNQVCKISDVESE